MLPRGCCTDTRRVAVTLLLVAPPPVMSWGAATCCVVAVALPPVARPRGRGRCSMVVPRGAAVCHVAVVLPLVAPPPVMLQGAATCHVVTVALSPVALPRGCGRCGVVVPRGAAVSCRCRAAARCAAVTAPPPVMSRGAATCHVVAVVLLPMGR